MTKFTGPPPLAGLKRRIDAHRQDQAAGGRKNEKSGMFVRQTFCMSRGEARAKAKEWFDEYPKAAYWTEVESWRTLEGDRIEFTMRRLPSAD
ncbi:MULTISPECIES: hypothetical protein [Rhizobium/Agrobacterium group]|jgi:hypothetical protein|uniref:hypothetical protein n=1 Tax=Rhizobium/Agrobacterium group TaxID=227290 RepID=UPI0007132731|nr:MULTISPECIES: hypothetical protein [Rhizobium/Agrobacterium group]KQQ61647.1 hypothetical protein ASF69_02960 [Rhizobium sp. Leaf311]